MAELRIPVSGESDIVAARQQGRALAEGGGFGGTDLTIVATVISELARNIFDYAQRGEICLEMQDGANPSFVIQARDEGPGIVDVPRALTDGYSTSGGLGLGLPGVRRLMDDFDIWSEPGRGTVVSVRKRLSR